MKSEQILRSDLLDIVFENRNKAYGAYELRRHYGRRLVRAMAIAIFLVGGLLSLAMMVKKEPAKAPFEEVTVFTLPPTHQPEKKKLQPKQEPARREAAKKTNVPQQKYVQNVLIIPNDAQADRLADNLDNVAISNTTSAGDTPTDAFIPVSNAQDGGGEVPAAPAVDRITPMASPDIMPEYPGGMNALKKFMEKNLQSFDEMERTNMVTVKITFVVGYDGKLKGFKVLEDGGAMYNNEVILVLKRMPEWIPGKAKGENVSVYYTIPVKFAPAE